MLDAAEAMTIICDSMRQLSNGHRLLREQCEWQVTLGGSSSFNPDLLPASCHPKSFAVMMCSKKFHSCCKPVSEPNSALVGLAQISGDRLSKYRGGDTTASIVWIAACQKAIRAWLDKAWPLVTYIISMVATRGSQ